MLLVMYLITTHGMGGQDLPENSWYYGSHYIQTLKESAECFRFVPWIPSGTKGDIFAGITFQERIIGAIQLAKAILDASSPDIVCVGWSLGGKVFEIASNLLDPTKKSLGSETWSAVDLSEWSLDTIFESIGIPDECFGMDVSTLKKYLTEMISGKMVKKELWDSAFEEVQAYRGSKPVPTFRLCTIGTAITPWIPIQRWNPTTITHRIHFYSVMDTIAFCNGNRVVPDDPKVMNIGVSFTKEGTTYSPQHPELLDNEQLSTHVLYPEKEGLQFGRSYQGVFTDTSADYSNVKWCWWCC